MELTLEQQHILTLICEKYNGSRKDMHDLHIARLLNEVNKKQSKTLILEALEKLYTTGYITTPANTTHSIREGNSPFHSAIVRLSEKGEKYAVSLKK
ncbi:MAG TPA: hypothetical protein VGL27_10870 [Negativicutes bacterium]